MSDPPSNRPASGPCLASRGLVLLAVLLAFPPALAGQNLVVNPGYEAWTRCPTGPGLVDNWVDDWFRGSVASTDFQHACGFNPHPARTDDGHLGFLAYDFSANYREYAVGQLTTPLAAGEEYLVEFWLILDAGRLHAVAEVGAYFSASRPSWPGTVPPVGVMPQVVNSSGLLTDKVDWMLVSERFVAAGGEQWVTIGNFSDDGSTTTFDFGCCGQYGAYYHLDDVSVVRTTPAAPCLHRFDLTSVAPFTPDRASVFMPSTPEGVSLQGAPWQCPFANGDLEPDSAALQNGVPLSYYQVSLATGTLLLEKSGTTIRFRF